jgi:hypothetical protein
LFVEQIQAWGHLVGSFEFGVSSFEFSAVWPTPLRPSSHLQPKNFVISCLYFPQHYDHEIETILHGSGFIAGYDVMQFIPKGLRAEGKAAEA